MWYTDEIVCYYLKKQRKCGAQHRTLQLYYCYCTLKKIGSPCSFLDHIYFSISWSEYVNVKLHNKAPNLIRESDKNKFPSTEAKLFSVQAYILHMCVSGEEFISRYCL
jgi:hypothetical protein